MRAAADSTAAPDHRARTVHRSDIRTPPTTARRSPRILWIVVSVAIAGYATRLAVLLSSGGLLGSRGYDDGVYYAAAAAFTHGRWPYVDFVFLQPPAILLAGAPFAGLAELVGDPTAVAAARLVWIGIGAGNCALIAHLAGRRSATAALIAGSVAAFFYPIAYGERSFLLEPLASLLLLLALTLRARPTARAALLAGALAGITIEVKIWCIIPVLVLAASGPRPGRFLAAAASSALLVGAPFLLHAPGPMIREVLLDQTGRPRVAGDDLLQRLLGLTGTKLLLPNAPDALLAPLAVGLTVLVAALAIVGATTVLGRQAAALLTATVLVLLASPSFFTHYLAYCGPWAALTIGLGSADLLQRTHRSARAVLLIGTLAATAIPTTSQMLATTRPTPDLAPIAAAARLTGCVRSDDPGLLAAINTLTRDLDRGCALWPDVTGHTLDRPDLPAIADQRPRSATWQTVLLPYLLSGAAVIVDRPGTGLSSASRQLLDGLPVLARSGPLALRATTPINS